MAEVLILFQELSGWAKGGWGVIALVESLRGGRVSRWSTGSARFMFTSLSKSRAVHFSNNPGCDWQTGPRRRERFLGPIQGSSVCSFLCESGKLGPQSDRQYGLGLAGSLFLFNVFSQNFVIYSIFFSCDSGHPGLGPLPLAICSICLPLLLHPTPWVALSQHPGRPLRGELDC